MTPKRLRKIRERLGLSQAEFAETFRLNYTSLRQWENGTRGIKGATVPLLMIIEAEPEAAMRALARKARR